MNRLASHALIHSNHRVRRVSICAASVALFLLMRNGAVLRAQAPPAQPQSRPISENAADAANSDATRIADVERRLNDVTDTLTQTQQVLQRSLLEIRNLRSQLDALRAQSAQAPVDMETRVPYNPPISPAQSTVGGGASPKSDIEALHEEQDALQAEIKQHDQIKVETVSKYPLRVTGLALFNAFTNAGVVDDVRLPALALPRFPGSSHGSAGATMGQTLLALEATGPTLAGARSSAAVSVDFFGGASSNVYGYNSTAGLVRMRQSQMRLDWEKTTVQASYMEPLISPRSPTSYATVAQPALAGSGNLWTWSPQLRVEQRVPISDRRRIAFEAGLIDPPSPGYTSIQLDTPVEASRRPGYEGRISYHADAPPGGIPHPFVFGVGVYSSDQFYNSATRVHSWAVTGDWQVPLSKWFELTGEIYRGRALGGLGGGAYKDTLTGTDIITGLTRTIGVEAAGGWSQLKLRLGSTLEVNTMFGLDNALSGNFDALILTSTNPRQFYARNSTVIGNLIFRPKTYLIVSPEYRRILSWRYTGPANIANIFTLTAGYQF